MPDIDKLRIQVESDAQKAHSGLESLIGTLNKLKQITAGGVGLKTVANQMNAFSQATNSLKSTGAANLIMIVAALKDLNGLRVNLPKSTVNNLQMLGNISTTSLTQTGAANISRFATSLRRIGEVSNVRISAALPKNMTALAEAAMAVQFSGLDPAVFTNVANGLAAFGAVGGGGGLKTTINQLERVPELAVKFNTVDIDKFTQKVRALGTSFKPLSTSVIGLEKSLKTLPASINALANASNKVVQSNSRMSSSFGSTLTRVGLAGLSLRALARAVASAINKSNEYVESLNLFNVSMGKYANEAGEYAERVNEIMGIDPASWMKNQGVFQTITEGFGVAADRAYIMSKNLTQLGYDLSSFFNISFEDAFQKLQSGISGELEPLRRLGYDLSQARLEATAAQLGIEKTFTTMNQAEKAQLRYYAIMTQVTDAQGDMARTLSAPSNQLRILKSQVSQAARAIGNIFIPVLNAILPVAIAAAKGIQIVMSAFASLLGYELPEVDYSGIQGATGAVGGLGDELESAGGAAKELKKYLMGFDEINQIPDLTGGGGGGSIGGGGGSDFDFELPSYDFIGEAVSGKVDQIMAKMEPALTYIKENADQIWSIAQGVAASLAMWKISNSFGVSLNSAESALGKVLEAAKAIGIMTVTIMLNYKFGEKFHTNSEGDKIDYGSLIAKDLTTVMGSYLTGIAAKNAFGAKFGKGAFVATLGINVGVEMYLNHKDANAEGYSAENAMSSVSSALKLALAGYTVGGVWGAVGGLVLGVAAGVVVYLTTPKKAVEYKFKEKNKLHLQAEDIEEFVKKQFAFDVDANVRVLTANAELSQAAKEQVKAAANGLAGSLNLINLGVDQETSVATLVDQITNEKTGIIASTQALLDQTAESLKITMSIAPPVSKNGEEQPDYATELYATITEANTVLSETVSSLGATLANLMEESLIRELTAGEKELANSISLSLINVSNILSGQSIATDFFKNTINIEWGDLSMISFEKAISYAKTEYLESIEEVRDAYETSLAEMQGIIWAAEASKKAVNAELDFAIAAGDEAQIAKYRAELEALDEVIANTQAQIDNFDMDSTLKGFGESLMSPMLTEIQSAIDTMYKEKAVEAINSGKPEAREAFEEYFSGLAKEVEAFGGLITIPEISYFSIYDKLVNGFNIDPQYVKESILNGGLEEGYTLAFDEFKAGFEKAYPGKGQWEFMDTEWTKKAREQLIAEGKDSGNQYLVAIRKAILQSEWVGGGVIPIKIAPEFEPQSQKDNVSLYQYVFGKEGYNKLMKDATAEAKAIARQRGAEVGSEVTSGMVGAILNDEGLLGSKMQKDLEEAFGVPIKLFKEVNEINSPSKVFERASGFIIEGIVGPLLKLPKALVPVYNVFKSTGDLLANTLTGGIVDKVSLLVENVNSLPTMHALTINIPGYSTVIKRIEAIRDGMRGITSGGAKVNIKVGVDPKSRQFLLTLARVADGSTLSKNLGELLEIDTYAHGGIPDHGELFIANERGPELVGRIGNKSAVANDEQIGDVILSYMERSSGSGGMDEERLASAIARELKAAGIGMVKLDGKTLAQSINRETQRTGRNAITLK